MVKRNKVVRPRQKPYRRKRRGGRNFFRSILFGSLAAVYFGALFWVLFYTSLAEIKNIEIKGVRRISASEIKEKVEQTLAGKNFLQMPRKQFFLVSADKVADVIVENFGAVRTVKVRKIFPDTLQIVPTEWERVFLWCVGDEESCYLLSDEGKILRKVSGDDKLISDNPTTKIIDLAATDVNNPVYAGKSVLPAKQLEVLRKISDALREISVPVKNEKILLPARVADEADIETSEGWTLRFDLNRSVAETVEMVRILLEGHLSPQQRRDLEYVDARISRKVFYKFRDDSPFFSSMEMASEIDKSKEE